MRERKGKKKNKIKKRESERGRQKVSKIGK